MKVFNKEIDNCLDCYMLNEEYNECKYTNTELGEDYCVACGIHVSCPFSKQVTIKDIESFGFMFVPSITSWILEFGMTKIYISIDETSCSIKELQEGEGYINVLFNGVVTSKPHLEFILKSLNIIKDE